MLPIISKQSLVMLSFEVTQIALMKVVNTGKRIYINCIMLLCAFTAVCLTLHQQQQYMLLLPIRVTVLDPIRMTRVTYITGLGNPSRKRALLFLGRIMLVENDQGKSFEDLFT